MNLDELRSVQSKERRKDSLQHLRDEFYDDVAAYIADLRAARDRRAEQVDNPFSDDDVRRMSDEIETAEEVAEALYERRVGKVVKLASFAAADMPVEQEGMTSQERELFEDLVARIERNKSSVLDVLAGEAEPDTPATDAEPASDPPRTDTVTEDAPTPTADDGAVPPESPALDAGDPRDLSADAEDPRDPSPDAGASRESASEAGGALADAMGGSEEPASSDAENDHTPVDPDPAPPEVVDAGGESEPAAEPAVAGDDRPPSESASGSGGSPAGSAGAEAGGTIGEPDAGADVDRATVRITRDVGEIFGVDEREYDLASDDVVTLPEANAEPLVQRDAAERLD